MKPTARFPRAILFALGTLLIFTYTTLSQAPCRGDLNEDNYVVNLPKGPDGKIHVNYAISADVPQNVRNAITNAVTQWNNRSGTTGVVFHAVTPTDPSTTVHLQFSSSTLKERTGGCAAYSTGASTIYYDPDFVKRVQRSLTEAAGTIAHEIGHFLGLDEAGVNPAQATIMNNPQVTATTTCENAKVPTNTVQAADATKAGSCIKQARDVWHGTSQDGRPSSTYYYKPGPRSQSCYDYYECHDYYACTGSGESSSCEYRGRECYLVNTTCY